MRHEPWQDVTFREIRIIAVDLSELVMYFMIRIDDTSKQIKLLHIRVNQFLSEKYTDEEISEELKKDGIDDHYSQSLIENVRNDKADKKSFRNSLIMGSFYVTGGLLLNFFSYKMAVVNNSNFFYLFWGIIVLGIVTIIRGVIIYSQK